MQPLQLSLAYNSKIHYLNVFFICLLLPIWSFFAPFIAVFFSFGVLFLGYNLHQLVIIIAYTVLFAIIIGGFAISYLAEDDKIYLNKEGLTLPWYFYFTNKFNTKYIWSDLVRAEILTNNNNKFLLLDFKDKPIIQLNLRYFKQDSINELLLALEIWGINCKRSNELIEYHDQLQNKNLADLNFTKLWQDELAYRFNATSFIPLDPGQKLQNETIKVIRQLAFGGFSAIYLVQKDNKNLYILKEAVVPNNCDSEQMQKAIGYLNKEFTLLSKISHPFIAKIFDYFVENNRHYLLLEYVNGQDLRQYIKQNGQLNEIMVVEIGTMLSKVLMYLHNLEPPIIHRDITPDNIVLKDNKEIILIDFGAANEFLSTATMTLVGKQAYISPEQFRGHPTPQTDLYALGGTLYFLLTGCDPESLAQNLVSEKIPNINPELNNLIASLTEFEESQRIKSAKDTLEILHGIKKIF